MNAHKRKLRVLAAAATILVISLSALTAVGSAKNRDFLGKVITKTSPLNIRSGNGTEYEVVSCAERSSYLRLLVQKGDWWKVEYENGKTGWCHADYIKTIGEERLCYVSTNGSALNVRKAKGIEGEIKDELSNGTCVRVLKDCGQWSRILYDENKTGYVYDRYLSDSPSGKYVPVRLYAALYKQTDPRWADKLLGFSRKTIAMCGCTTSCLAMSESYIQKTDITPDEMEQRLSYSDSGSLYWPSCYTTSTDEGSFREEVYRSLCAGIPVILGAENESGRQHWVLITGYDGNTAQLCDEGFLINDPSTVSRTRLSELFEDHPTFLKIAYYAAGA